MSDLISRKDAIDAMTTMLWHYPTECLRNINEYEFAKGLAELGLKSVPSVQPETATVITKCLIDDIARWYACGACGVSIGCKDRYCRNCGRKLKHE